jgi:glucan-binding YG repeat protein
MHTGWRRIGVKWYFMDENGAMVTGEREIGSISYTFDEEGVCLNP